MVGKGLNNRNCIYLLNNTQSPPSWCHSAICLLGDTWQQHSSQELQTLCWFDYIQRLFRVRLAVVLKKTKKYAWISVQWWSWDPSFPSFPSSSLPITCKAWYLMTSWWVCFASCTSFLVTRSQSSIINSSCKRIFPQHWSWRNEEKNAPGCCSG